MPDAAGLVNHWTEMPEWDDQTRRLWAVYFTFHDQPVLHEAVVGYQQVLRREPGLDMVQLDWLHLTMTGICFSDEIDPARMAHLERAANRHLRRHRLPPLTAGPPIIDKDAISLPVVPVGEITEVRDEIVRLAHTTLGDIEIYRLPEPTMGFRPHISIAYANRDFGESEAQALLDLTEPRELALDVHEISLIELHRAERTWRWSSERRIRLGSGVDRTMASRRRARAAQAEAGPATAARTH